MNTTFLPQFLRGLTLAAVWNMSLLLSLQSVRAENVFIAARGMAIPEAGWVTNTVLCTPRHELAFLPPRNWREKFDTNALIFVWSSSDYVTELRLRIAPSWQAGVLKPEELREKIARDFPKARVTEEFSCYTGSGQGLAFDLAESSEQGIATATRMAFVPFGGGMIEISLVTPLDQLEKNHLVLGHFLNSLRAGPRLKS